MISFSVYNYLVQYRQYYRSEIPRNFKNTGVRQTGPPIFYHPAHYCQYGAEFIPVIIKTDVKNYLRRAMQRKIIKLEQFFMKSTNISYVFLLGHNSKMPLPAGVADEIIKYDDIVIADYDDTYKNLTLKTTVALELAASPDFVKSCNNYSWLLIQDDDVYIRYVQVGLWGKN